MSEEVDGQNPVVEDEVKEQVSPEAELTTPPQDSQEPKEENLEHVEEGRKTVPRERFDQVWARTKKAEARLDQIQAELQREREEKIRLEERAKVQTEQQTQQEWTWDQLETFIAEGKITRGQAQEYKDKMTEQRLERKFRQAQEQEKESYNVLKEIKQYQELVPDSMTFGSESRQRYEREFNYLVRNGAPKNHVTELAACRAAFGDPETIRARNTTKKVITPKEPFMETHSSSQSSKAPSKSFKETLSSEKVSHYERMMRSGLVKDWKEVEALEKWEPKVVGGRR